MNGDTDTLIAERDRLLGDLAGLDEKQMNLEIEQDAITRKVETAKGDTDILSQCKTEAEQVAEAKRKNDRLIYVAKGRLTEVRQAIAMQQQSDIV